MAPAASTHDSITETETALPAPVPEKTHPSVFNVFALIASLLVVITGGFGLIFSYTLGADLAWLELTEKRTIPSLNVRRSQDSQLDLSDQIAACTTATTLAYGYHGLEVFLCPVEALKAVYDAKVEIHKLRKRVRKEQRENQKDPYSSPRTPSDDGTISKHGKQSKGTLEPVDNMELESIRIEAGPSTPVRSRKGGSGPGLATRSETSSSRVVQI